MTSTVLILLLVGFTIAGFLFLRRPATPSAPSGNRGARAKTTPRKKVQPSAAERNPFRATSIICGRSACEAAKTLEGQPYLIEKGQIPTFPLPNCDAAKCACKYRHHDDRRDPEGDRRSIAALRSQLHRQAGNTERRVSEKDRRKTTWDDYNR